VLKTDEVQTVFFQVCIEAAVEAACYGSWDKKYEGSISHKPRLNGRPIEALARLMVVLVRMAGCDFKQTNKTTVMANLPVRVQLASKVLHTIVEVMRRDSALLTFRCESGQEKETLNCPPSTRDGAGEVGLALNQRAYYKLFLCLISDLLAPDQLFETIRPQLLTALANALHCLQPKILPGFTFAWLELLSQRQLLTALLRSQKESSLFHMLLLDILEFTAPYLVAVQLNEPLRLLYREVMRLLLVLLHEFPDFLCINYLSLCDILPPSCVQMRNVILSAYPINVRLPNPFLPTLKADWLPELSQSPLISTSATLEILPDYLREKITGYMENKDVGLYTLILKVIKINERNRPPTWKTFRNI
jgi:CCR4-NOT transcription complex subunit 1